MSAKPPSTSRYPRRLKRAVLLLGLICSMLTSAALTDFSSKLLNAVSRKWGSSAAQRLIAWQDLIEQQKPKVEKQWHTITPATLDALKNVNAFFNKVPYLTDQAHWGVNDYWLTAGPIGPLDWAPPDQFASAISINVPRSFSRMSFL